MPKKTATKAKQTILDAEIPLKTKMAAFCREYIIDMNATQAAIRAGYSEKTAGAIGHENLQKPEIQKYIKKLIDERAEKTGLSAQWVLDRLQEIVERCMQHEAVRDRQGEPTGEYKFDSSGANKSLELIGRHLKMFTDSVELAGKGGGPMELIITRRIVDASSGKP